MKSGTSVGANYRAACRAKSRADFIAKMGIVEEANETLYWLELLLEAKLVLLNQIQHGDTEPSEEDIKITNRIIQACDLVGIKVLDHIIIGKNEGDYYSFAREGLIK